MYLTLIHVPNAYSCAQRLFMYPKLVHVSNAYSCTQRLFMCPTLIHIPNPYSCNQRLNMYPTLIHIPNPYSCTQRLFMYQRIPTEGISKRPVHLEVGHRDRRQAQKQVDQVRHGQVHQEEVGHSAHA